MGKTTLPALIGGATKTTLVGQDAAGSYFAYLGLADPSGSPLGTAQNPLVVQMPGVEQVSNKGVAGGYAALGSDGKVPAAQLPASSGTVAHIVSGAYDSSGNLIFTLSDGSTLPPIAPPGKAPAMTGFYMNGASNSKLKAAVARVKNGTGRARMVVKGDSTEVGQGGGSNADGNRLTGARANRPASVLAGLLTNSGIPAFDGSIVADNGLSITSIPIYTYDPRVGVSGPNYWGTSGNQNFAGGGYFTTNTGGLSFNPPQPVDTFEIVYYNSANLTFYFAIDGAAPASGPSSATASYGTGIVRQIVKASSVGSHTLNVTASSAAGAFRSITAYDSTKAGLDILVHASLAAVATQQAAKDSSSGWYNADSLVFDAPDLTTIKLGLNDMNTNVAVADYKSALQSIVADAQKSGDVLMLFPTPSGGNYNNNVSAFNDAAKSVASAAGVPFFSLWEYYGPWTSTFGARQADGVVHPNTALYAEIAGLVKSAIDSMIAA